jgi:hypothetical protein
MTVQYTVQISDADYKALCYVTENPNTYVDEHVTEYIRQMKEDLVKEILKSELAKPGMRSIPADKEELIRTANVKTQKQIVREDTLRMEAMVISPDAHDSDIGEAVELPE